MVDINVHPTRCLQRDSGGVYNATATEFTTRQRWSLQRDSGGVYNATAAEFTTRQRRIEGSWPENLQKEPAFACWLLLKHALISENHGLVPFTG